MTRRPDRFYMPLWGLDRFADTAFEIATTWYILHNSGSPGLAGLFIGLSHLPSLLLSLFGGATGDRAGFVRVATRTMVGRIIFFAGVIAAFHYGLSWIIVVLCCAAMTVLDSFHFPSTSALGAKIAAVEAISQKTMQARRFTWGKVGSALAGPIIGVLISRDPQIAAAPGLVAAVVVFVLLYVVAAALPKSKDKPPLREKAAPQNASPSLIGRIRPAVAASWAEVVDGWDVIGSGSGNRLRLLVFAAANFLTVGPILLGVPLKSTLSTWSPVTSAVAFGGPIVGQAVGGVTVKWLHKIGTGIDGLTLSIALLVPAAAGLVSLSATNIGWVVGAGGAVAGLFSAWSVITMNTDLYDSVPENYYGRIAAVADVAAMAPVFIGQALFGVAASGNQQVAGVAFGVALALVGLLGSVLSRRRIASTAGV